MTHRTRHIQTRAPVESFRFPILFPDSAPDPLLALLDSAIADEYIRMGSNRVTAIITQRMCHPFVSKTTLISNSCD
jgi:hypothetical protein